MSKGLFCKYDDDTDDDILEMLEDTLVWNGEAFNETERKTIELILELLYRLEGRK